MFRDIVETTDVGILNAGADGEIYFANRAIEEMFGYPRSELIGSAVEMLLPVRLRRRHSVLRQDYFLAPCKRYLSGAGFVGANREGVEFPVEIGLSPIDSAAGRSVVATVIDVSLRQDAQASLIERVAELQRANERLSQFAEVASRDLNEPLQRIALQSELLNQTVATGDRQKIAGVNRTIQEWARSARELVADLLTYSRAVHADLEIDILDLAEEIRRALSELADAITATGAQIRLDLAAFRIRADRRQVSDLLRNILSNAIKYHKPEQPPRISIQTFRSDGMVRLVIEDQGIGFDDQFAERIFEPFKRLHSRIEYPGSGVGLATCKSIADRHGWGISVKSQPGEGAVFTILIPQA